MTQQGFEDYSYLIYGHKNGTANSYLMAIHIIDRIFEQEDCFGLQGQSLTEINDSNLLKRIAEFIIDEEKKYKQGLDSIFRYGLDSQTSYPRKGFCSAAIKHLLRYQSYDQQVIKANNIINSSSKGKSVSRELIKNFDLTKEGKNKISTAKVRLGQSYFREMILNIYSGKCCVTGLNVPQLLRASHIVAWAD